jgi:RNA polymerase sigma factor (sigma-70 family)
VGCWSNFPAVLFYVCIARPPPSEITVYTRSFWRNAYMTKTEKELKKEFSAYVKTAIKNTQKQYLIKKGKIRDNEIAMDDEGIDEILQKQTEDLFDKMDLNVDMVLSDEINVNSFLDQINDPVLYVSLCSLKELQQKVLMLRIVYVKSFDDIGGILNMTAKQAENSYYNAIRKIRKQMGDNFG